MTSNLDIQLIMDIFNEILAVDSDAAHILITNKINCNNSLRSMLNVEKNDITFLSILNKILAEHGEDLKIGAEIYNNEIQFFHILGDEDVNSK